MGKGDYTFLVETDDGLIRLREKDGPVFTNPRLGPAIRFLHDIHLLGENGLKGDPARPSILRVTLGSDRARHCTLAMANADTMR